jgi:hypothetical protein
MHSTSAQPYQQSQITSPNSKAKEPISLAAANHSTNNAQKYNTSQLIEQQQHWD